MRIEPVVVNRRRAGLIGCDECGVARAAADFRFVARWQAAERDQRGEWPKSRLLRIARGEASMREPTPRRKLLDRAPTSLPETKLRKQRNSKKVRFNGCAHRLGRVLSSSAPCPSCRSDTD